MKKHKFFKKFVLLFSLFVIISTMFQSTFAFVVTETQTLTNTFIPFKSIISDLIINKTVEHPFGEDYVIPDNIEFDFEINLGNKYAGKTFITTVGEKVADEAGIITVNAKPGVPVGIQGIDENTSVKVTELEKENDGFNVKDGIASKEVTVTSNGDTTANFVNIYTPDKVQSLNVSVTGTKILEGRDWKKGDTFSFLLEQNDGAGNWISLDTKSVTYNSDDEEFNNFDFNNIVKSLEFNKIGTYSFRLSEVVGSIENMNYDKTINYFNIIVSDNDMDGKLEIQNVTASGNVTVTKGELPDEYNVDATFNNIFVSPSIPEPEAIEVPINVIKTVKNVGDKSIGPENFEFVLEKIHSDEKLTLKSDENGLAIFKLDFTSEDIGKTFNYKLTETNDGREGVTYSDKVYNIQISITLGVDNKLLYTMRCDSGIVKELNAEFENIYRSEYVIPDEPSESGEPEKPTQPDKPADKTDSDTDNNKGKQDDSQNNTNNSYGKDVLLTGDTTNITLLFTIFVISALIWVILLVSKTGKEKPRQK
ncbi:MAG: FctA domain-containing protein [Acutalibacteraceae bacterium]|nr:FctA domain-containing protein [Acutalibacteraceae bacterium]